MTLNKKLKELEQKIQKLESKVIDLTNKTEAIRIKPESRVPQIDLSNLASSPLPSSGTGLGQVPGFAAGIIWNNADGLTTPWGQQPSTPTKGYNKHNHSRYSGGALDINSLELVEYEDLDVSGHNKHCQSYWKTLPIIAKDGDVDKIGLLDITFDKVSGKWLAGGLIDVELTQFLQKDSEGNILTDDKSQEMKAPLIGGAVDNTNVVWDDNAKCWRFYAVYAD